MYVCRNLAYGYLQAKVHRGKFDPSYFGVSLEDIALDCVAPLFRRGDDGRFTKLVNYFSPLDLATLTDAELVGATRRLVFSKVNEELVRLYKESDPSLSMVIRSIKYALKYSHRLIPVVRSNEYWIQIPDSRPEEDVLPVMPAEILETALLARLERRTDFRHILGLVAEVLSNQDLYQKQYSLVGAAVVIRSLMVRSYWNPTETEGDGEQFMPGEIDRFIRESIQRTKSSLTRSYLEKGKLSASLFESYFNTVSDILEAEFISNDGMELTYFESLQRHLTDLHQEEYLSRHRIYLEYLVKLTRMNFLESVKREIITSPQGESAENP